MTPSYGNTKLAQPHQLSQHLGPLDHWNTQLSGPQYLRIVRSNGRRGDHHVCVLDPAGLVSLVNLAAETAQPPGDVCVTEVRPAHPVAQIEKQLSNAAHANAAYAHEMDLLVFVIHKNYSATVLMES